VLQARGGPNVGGKYGDEGSSLLVGASSAYTTRKTASFGDPTKTDRDTSWPDGYPLSPRRPALATRGRDDSKDEVPSGRRLTFFKATVT
jgi:hypothetical protein